MRPLRSYVSTAAALTALMAVVGCSGDDPPGADPSSSPTASPTPTESSSPTVEPATGDQLRSLVFRVRVPEGWTTDKGQTGPLLTTRYGALETPDGIVAAHLSTSDGTALLDRSLSKLAREKARSSEFEKPPEILDDIEVDGVPAYFVSGPVGRHQYVAAMGTIHDDNLVEMQLKAFTLSPQEVQETFDSILASWQWR